MFGITVAILSANVAYQRGYAERIIERRMTMEAEVQAVEACSAEEPRILEEIQVEELAIDGICGVY